MAKRITLFLTLLCVYCFASAADYLTFTAEEDSSTVKILSNEAYREALDGPRIVVTDDTIYAIWITQGIRRINDIVLFAFN